MVDFFPEFSVPTKWRAVGGFSCLPFSHGFPAYTYVCIYIFTRIASKWGLGDLKGQELNTCFCCQDREKNSWAVRALDRPLPSAEERKKQTAPAGISLLVIIKNGNFICYKNLHLKVERNWVLLSHKPQGPAEIGRRVRFSLREHEERGRVSGKEYVTNQVCL